MNQELIDALKLIEEQLDRLHAEALAARDSADAALDRLGRLQQIVTRKMVEAHTNPRTGEQK